MSRGQFMQGSSTVDVLTSALYLTCKFPLAIFQFLKE